MPLKAWRRAFLCTLAGVLPLYFLARTAVGAPPVTKGLCLVGALAILAIAGFLLWLYLPDVDWPGRTLRRAKSGKKRIAITFDDGPNGEHTSLVLDTLKKHGARATFFCVGEAATKYPDIVKRIAAEGHAIGNHTLEHRLLPWLPPEEVRRQLAETQARLTAAGAPMPTIFRAPKGFKNRHLPKVLEELKLSLIGWTTGVWDTDCPGVDVIVNRAKSRMDDGTILLLHDGLPGKDRSQTALALDQILAECTRRGLQPVTIPELVADR